MPRPPFLDLGRIIERMARISPPGHRDLVEGMVAELDAIADGAERRRFALGAVAAIARLALTGYGGTGARAIAQLFGVRTPEEDANPGGSSMSKLTTSRLLRRHIAPFGVFLVSLTLLLLANTAAQQAPRLTAMGGSASAIFEVLLLSVPFTLALTIPMAILLTVLWVFTRLGAEGVLESARRERHGIARLVAPVLGAAAVIGALTLVSNSQVVPRANAQLVSVLTGVTPGTTDRTMTIGELREAARSAGAGNGAEAAAYQVEIQKKFALAAACVVLALAGAAIPIRFPGGGLVLVFLASGAVFSGYYLTLVAGESLADRQVMSPFVAMWMANVVFLTVALFLGWGPGRPRSTPDAETLAIGGL